MAMSTAPIPAAAAPRAEAFKQVRAERLKTTAMAAPAVVTTFVLFGGALAGATRSSIEPNPTGASGVSLDAWEAVVDDPGFLDASLFTLQTSALATLLAAAVALAAAQALHDRGSALRGLFSLPVPVPHLIVAILALLWLAPGGLADRLLGPLPVELTGDRAGIGIVLVYVYKEAPFLTLLLLAAWGARVRGREEAAAVLGATAWQRWRWVVWPVLRAPLAVGSLIVAAFVVGSFEVPLTVGPTYPPTLSVSALEATRSADLSGQAQASATLLVAAALTIALALAAAWAARTVDG